MLFVQRILWEVTLWTSTFREDVQPKSALQWSKCMLLCFLVMFKVCTYYMLYNCVDLKKKYFTIRKSLKSVQV